MFAFQSAPSHLLIYEAFVTTRLCIITDLMERRREDRQPQWPLPKLPKLYSNTNPVHILQYSHVNILIENPL